MDTLVEAVESLAELRWYDYCMLIVTISAAVAASIAAFFAYQASKAANETDAMQVFFEAYRRFYDIERDYLIFVTYHPCIKAADDWKIRYRYALVEYYNAVDYVCAKYLYDRISSRCFDINMRKEIKRLWTDEKLLEDLEMYDLHRSEWGNIGKACAKMWPELHNGDQVF